MRNVGHGYTPFIVLVGILVAGQSRADVWRVSPAAQTAGLGASTAFVVIREGDSGGPPLDLTAQAMTLNVDGTAELSTGFNPYGTWATSIGVNMSAGQATSPAFYFHSDTPGVRNISGTVGAIQINASQVTVSPEALTEGFERSTLLLSETPPGPWLNNVGVPGATMALSAAAAHRGSVGVRLDDTDGSTAGGEQGRLALSGDVIASDHFNTRFWLRVTPTVASGREEIIQVLWALGVTPMELAWVLTLDHPSQTLILVGRNRSTGATTVGTAAAPVLYGQWQLIEVSMTGVGTAVGSARLRVDGQTITQVTGLDWTSRGVERIQLGQPSSANRSFTGFIDFDDIRAGVDVHAERLVLEGIIGQASVGDCVPLVIQLQTGDGSAVPAPYSVDLTMTSGPVTGTFHTDASCLNAPGNINLPSGATGTTVYFQPTTEGNAELRSSAPDFLPPSTFVAVTVAALSTPSVDGGSPSVDGPPVDELPVTLSGPLEFRVNGGCQAAPVPFSVLALLAAWKWGRRRN